MSATVLPLRRFVSTSTKSRAIKSPKSSARPKPHPSIHRNLISSSKSTTTSSTQPAKPSLFKPLKQIQPTRYITSKVLYQDNGLVIINKPTNCSLQGRFGSEARGNWDALIGGLRIKLKNDQINPIHRLDKSTTGTLLLSTSQQSHKSLSLQIQKHEVIRKYLALVRGRIKIGWKDKIEGKLRIDEDRVRVVKHSETEDSGMGEVNEHTGDGNGVKVVDAVTEWECLRESPHGYSLLLLSPQTGRKHQLRVHCSQILKSPIIGDFKYSTADPKIPLNLNDDDDGSDVVKDSEISKEIEKNGSGMYLHAWSVRLHRWDKQTRKRRTISCEAPLPWEFRRVIKKLGWDEPMIEKDGGVWPEGYRDV